MERSILLCFFASVILGCSGSIEQSKTTKFDTDSDMGLSDLPKSDVSDKGDVSEPGPDSANPTDTGMPDVGPTLPTGPNVDPECTDGMYSEASPDINANISDIVFDNAFNYYLAVLDRRYPVGSLLVEGGQNAVGPFTACVDAFGGGITDASSAMQRIGTIVHECGHFYDLSQGAGQTSKFVIREDLVLSCDGGKDRQFNSGSTFARSLINNDEYSALRPPCSVSAQSCDTYADIYLNGDPNNNSFEGGDQGYALLLEETVQYVNSLAVAWAFLDQRSPNSRTSARDGILTFLWYIERYHKYARLNDPAAYAVITDPCWRDATLTVWGRAWLFLETTKEETGLSINGADILPLVMEPDLLAEIQELRRLEGCAD